MAKNNTPTLAMPDKDWQAEDDARTLMRANEIMTDPKRMKAAMKASDKLVKEYQKNVDQCMAVKKGTWAKAGGKK